MYLKKKSERNYYIVEYWGHCTCIFIFASSSSSLLLRRACMYFSSLHFWPSSYSDSSFFHYFFFSFTNTQRSVAVYCFCCCAGSFFFFCVHSFAFTPHLYSTYGCVSIAMMMMIEKKGKEKQNINELYQGCVNEFLL